MFTGFVFSGYLNPNHIDLSPTFAGTLFGITNTFTNLGGFIAPQVGVYFIHGQETSLAAWTTVWTITIVITCIGGFAFAVAASGEKQPWNDRKMNISDQIVFEKKQFIASLIPSAGSDI